MHSRPFVVLLCVFCAQTASLREMSRAWPFCSLPSVALAEEGYSLLHHGRFASVERQRNADNDYQAQDALLKIGIDSHDVHAVFHDSED
jgi:hypothetical protein